MPLIAGEDDEETADEDAPAWSSDINASPTSGVPLAVPPARTPSLFALLSSWFAPLLHW